MILNKLEDFTNAILRGEEIKHETVFYTGELDEVTSPEIGGEYKVNGQKVGVVAAFLNGNYRYQQKRRTGENELERGCRDKKRRLALSD